jgi:hypothetical protein
MQFEMVNPFVVGFLYPTARADFSPVEDRTRSNVTGSFVLDFIRPVFLATLDFHCFSFRRAVRFGFLMPLRRRLIALRSAACAIHRSWRFRCIGRACV